MDINNYYLVISNRHKDKRRDENPCKFSPHWMTELLYFSVYWQIKRIFVSEDQKNNENKFKTMINAIKVQNNWPKYSEVLWVVRSWFNRSSWSTLSSGSSEAAVEGEHQRLLGAQPLDQQGHDQAEDVWGGQDHHWHHC